MIAKVRTDDQNQFSDSDWSSVDLHSTKIFTDTKKILGELSNFYSNNFSELVYAQTMPTIDEIIIEIEKLSKILEDKKL